MKRIQVQSLALFVACVFTFYGTRVRAATVEGVQLPRQMMVNGTRLALNGVGLRTATLLRLKIYVAGLYLEQPTHDAQVILASSETKLLRFVFLREIDADKARAAWRQSLDQNCKAPCYLPPAEVAQFLAQMPAMRQGDTADVVFTADSVDFKVNGRNLGQITDPTFARVVLLGYIGPEASAPAVRQGVLGLR